MSKSYTSFILKSIIFLFILSLILYLYFLICLKFSKTPMPTKWTYNVLKIKDEIANNKQSPKIILLGGSNVLYGLSAEMIERSLDVPTINYGSRAGLKDYIFEKAKNILKQGDVVILEMDYPFYFYNKKIAFEKQSIKERYILTHDKNYYNNLNVIEKLNLVLIGLENLSENMQKSFPEQSYSYKTINEWGDETRNKIEDKKNLKSSNHIKLKDNYKNNFLSSDGTKEILKFISWSEKNNIKIFATFPAMANIKEYKNDQYEEFFNILKKFYNDNKIKIIGEPYDYLFDDIKLFYDAPSHLNNVGRELKTKYIIQILKIK